MTAVRNTPQPAQEDHQASSGGLGYSRDLIERMVALVARMAENDIPLDQYLDIKTEARAIVAEMAPVVDPIDESLIEETAKAIYASYEYVKDWDHPDSARIHHRHARKAAVAAIRRGRELETTAHLRLHAKGGTR